VGALLLQPGGDFSQKAGCRGIESRYDDGRYSTWLDPFCGGRLLGREHCHQLAKESAGVDISADPEALRPASRHLILVRMVNNLRALLQRSAMTEQEARTFHGVIKYLAKHKHSED